ncbi:type II toxin-antitoxin system VapC family toxin [bacterium]|nr:type II toxin-antitoxin system VapC family toxin [bacterium]
MITAVADSHVLNWYLSGDKPLSDSARQHLETTLTNRDQIAVSTISIVELIYLTEKGRIGSKILTSLTTDLSEANGLFKEIPLDIQVARAFTRIVHADIPEMFDRVIAATALMLNVPLITADHKIRAANIPTIW